MCGICGQLRFDHHSPKREIIEKMMTKIKRRGPDDFGVWMDEKIGLGHQRLSVIDLSENAHQPMVDETLGKILIFNGTIYNYQWLREKLRHSGYRFFSHSDTEVIIKAYDFWGADCVRHLDGMFAFALWDKNARRLFLARDRMGIKPLYFSADKNAFSFASNLQALTAIGANRTINPTALNFQLSLHASVPAPHTIFNGVKKMRPAATMTIDENGKTNERRYWFPKIERNDKIDEDEYIEKTKGLLTRAVGKYLQTSDVPVGVLLSGGLDSSLIVALLAKNHDQNFHTFSIGFENIDDEPGSEFEYSDAVVRRFKTRHQKYMIENSEVLPRLVDAVDHMAEPMVAQDAIGFYLLAEKVAKTTKVILSGQGADEVFGGYFWYPKMQTARGTMLRRFCKHYLDRPFNEFLQTVAPKYQTENLTEKWLAEEFQKTGADDFMDKVFRLDITRLIVDDPVKRVDNMTMAWGLEARVPFMDHHLVEWALNIPPALKLRNGGKYPLKKIAENLLPDKIINRKKGYFPMPSLKYVRGEFLIFMRDILNSRACIERGIFNRDYVKKILARPEKYMTALEGSRLWHLALLEFWLTRHG